MKLHSTKYSAYTLLELLVVMSIFIILGGMTFSSFDGLQNTIKMNEYMLNLEQDIRSVQRSAMLLQRDPNEKWLYGLGIDFSDMGEDGVYTVFKWCSPYDDYGDIATKSDLPAYIGGTLNENNGKLPLTVDGTIPLSSTCDSGIVDIPLGGLRTQAGYDRTITLPKSQISFEDENGVPTVSRYVIFESVSGRAFLYDGNGSIVNYTPEGNLLEDTDTIESFNLVITPLGKGSTRKLSVRPLSGKIDTYIY